jgi:hypothetical protein
MDVHVISALLMLSLGFVFAAAQAPRPAPPPAPSAMHEEVPAEVNVKAGLLFNFAKFGVWPALRADTPLVLCVVGAAEIASVLTDTARGMTIAGHALEVRRPETTAWATCHVLFIADAASRAGVEGVRAIRALPVLTVGDGKGFSRSGGIIEFYIRDGHMRFIINLDALERAGLRLSSRLLYLAKTIRDGDD